MNGKEERTLNMIQVLQLAKSVVSYVPKDIRFVVTAPLRAARWKDVDFVEPRYYNADDALIAIEKVLAEVCKLDALRPDEESDCLHACAARSYDFKRVIKFLEFRIRDLEQELKILKHQHEEELQQVRDMYDSAYES